ncbi:chromosome 11 open reading frame 65 [Plakobranchus ocellatus]|uniref:Chromosome 11 open reading frame 65 n=1 Tax=Plakobranchus ocellatus TaxID=259542 RepID=A0AAV3ZF08_9GAST|nr:chromosome 11 open reading frame 65 [Plakobranchus ocellatus]
MEESNPLARLHLEQLYNQYVQEQMDNQIPATDIASYGFFCSHMAKSWKPGQIQPHVNSNNQVSQNFSAPEAVSQNPSGFSREPVRHPLSHGQASSSGDSALRTKVQQETEAAIIIQRVWRRHIDRFPPNIYYKIYTNRPIQDMCANSPKDYTKEVSKRLTVKDQHSHVRVKDILEDNQDGWYRRVENNGWRLVSDRLIHHIMNDSVTWETSRKEYKFEHNRLKRRQDVEKRKKQMKIEWMQKMYKEGMLKAKANDRETVQLIEGAAAGMVATVEALGPDALEDWEVDELLDWTTSLNFDEYRHSWEDLATSATSQKILEEKFRLSTNMSDPYELSLSTGPSRYTSAHQSRFTPMSLNSAHSDKPVVS